MSYEVAIKHFNNFTLFWILADPGFIHPTLCLACSLLGYRRSIQRCCGVLPALHSARDAYSAGADLTMIDALAATTGSYPLAISLLSLIYIVGLPFVALAAETAN